MFSKVRVSLSIILLGLLTACGSSSSAQVQVLVVSATPNQNAIPITITPTGNVMAVAAVTQTGAPANDVPAETWQQTYIAQQDFEHGYMYWISTKQEIWVLITAQGNQGAGEWQPYPDTFKQGEPETDPSLASPSALLFQPKRGFGKVWRETPGLRDLLGWATTPEFDLRTPLVYQPGAALDSNGKIVSQPGHYELTSLYCQPFALYEPGAGQTNGMWQKLISVQPGPAKPDGTSTPAPTPTAFTPPAAGTALTALPAEIRSQLYIAQQDFEHGYMFWLSNQGVIWVLLKDQGVQNSGEWRVYQDTFKEGEPETDPSLIAPTTTPLPMTLTPVGVPFYQPRRGFGKLWRTVPGLRDALGWALTPDFDLRTPFVYQPGYGFDPTGKLVTQPGRYLLTSLGCVTFGFNEPKAGQTIGTWAQMGTVAPGSGD